MKIALVAPIVEPIPPQKYGGIEAIVYALAEGATEAGHDVTLLASGDSKTSATLMPALPQALRRYPEATDIDWQKEMKTVALAESLKHMVRTKFDIIHSHLDWKLLPFEELIPVPVVTTTHGIMSPLIQQSVYTRYPQAKMISISLSQRRPLPSLNYIANIYNGIDIERFPFGAKADDYFFFLGRMSPEKGPHLAIAAAKQAGVRLIMAAKIDVVDEEFFAKEVKPHIDGEQIQFLGEIGHEDKIAYLQRAKGLLFPIQWDEPFGLVMIEAMACGVPVIVTRHGSALEVVTHKETGFLVGDSVDEIVEAIERIETIDRQACRTRVENNFTTQHMVNNYLKTYQEVLS